MGGFEVSNNNSLPCVFPARRTPRLQAQHINGVGGAGRASGFNVDIARSTHPKRSERLLLPSSRTRVIAGGRCWSMVVVANILRVSSAACALIKPVSSHNIPSLFNYFTRHRISVSFLRILCRNFPSLRCIFAYAAQRPLSYRLASITLSAKNS